MTMDDSHVVRAQAWLAENPTSEAAEVVAGVVEAYDERMRVNVGLVAENAELRRAAQSPPASPDTEALRRIVEAVRDAETALGRGAS